MGRRHMSREGNIKILMVIQITHEIRFSFRITVTVMVMWEKVIIHVAGYLIHSTCLIVTSCRRAAATICPAQACNGSAQRQP